MFVVTGNYMDRKNQTEKYRMRGFHEKVEQSVAQPAIDASGIKIVDVTDEKMPESMMMFCYAAAIAKVSSAVPPETPIPEGARQMGFSGVRFYDHSNPDVTVSAAKSIHLRPNGMFYVPA